MFNSDLRLGTHSARKVDPIPSTTLDKENKKQSTQLNDCDTFI
jgi:hypothetical protein